MKDLVLLLAAFALSVVLVEAGARLLGVTPDSLAFDSRHTRMLEQGWSDPDPALGWIGRPGVRPSEEAGHAPMTYLDHGRRLSTALDKSLAARQVMVVGCSFTQGEGVTDAETYVYRLNQSLPDVDFENFGTAGYGTVQSMLMAERQFSDFYSGRRPPDLVLYGLISDHINRNASYPARIISLRDRAGRYLLRPHGRIEDGRLVWAPPGIIEPWPLEKSSAIVGLLHHAWIRLTWRVGKGERIEITRAALEEFDERVREAGSRLLVVLLADGDELKRTVLQGARVTYVDCTHPDYDRDPSLRIGGTGHPTAAVHAHWAACIADWLKTHAVPSVSSLDAGG
jgi:hypothetical protein